MLVAMDNLSRQLAALQSTLRQAAIADPSPSAGEGRDRALFFDNSNDAAVDRPRNSGSQARPIKKPALPDPGIIRRIIRQRKLRSSFFKGDLFADPAWDMILDLAAAAMEGKQVAFPSLCIASCVPPSTALRWIKILSEVGLVRSLEDPQDQRGVVIALTDAGLSAVVRYFEVLGADSKVLV